VEPPLNVEALVASPPLARSLARAPPAQPLSPPAAFRLPSTGFIRGHRATAPTVCARSVFPYLANRREERSSGSVRLASETSVDPVSRRRRSRSIPAQAAVIGSGSQEDFLPPLVSPKRALPIPRVGPPIRCTGVPKQRTRILRRTSLRPPSFRLAMRRTALLSHPAPKLPPSARPKTVPRIAQAAGLPLQSRPILRRFATSRKTYPVT